MERSDEQLLAATGQDPEAFGEFYRRHEDRMLRFFFARTHDAELTADLTAEVFAAALASAHRFRPRSDPAVAWLYGIARNVLALSRRRGVVESDARRKLGMARIELTDASLERIEALEEDRDLMRRFDELPPSQRAAVRARVIDERSYEEIAAELRCSEQVVRKRVSRGLAGLRGALEENA